MQIIGMGAPLVVANHAKYTDWVDLQGLVVAGIFIPDITGTKLTFEAIPKPNTDRKPVLADTGYPVCVAATGVALEYTIADNTFLQVPVEAFLGVRWLRLKFTTDQVADITPILQTTTWGA